MRTHDAGFELQHCSICNQMTNHLNSECQKHTYDTDELYDTLYDLAAVNVQDTETGEMLYALDPHALVRFIRSRDQSIKEQAQLDLLSDLIRNCTYTSGAKKVDYVPVFRLEDKVSNIEKRIVHSTNNSLEEK